MRVSAQSLAQNYQGESILVVAGDEEANDEAVAPDGETKADYQLAYPGILPDHFLYPLKMIRDRIWLFLTTDSLKKAELLLTYADKRIWAAQMLLDKGKEDLAVTTATKAEKYLEQAAARGEEAKKAGKEADTFLERLSQAAQKHEEVLLNLQGRVSDQSKGVIEKTLEYSQKLQTGQPKPQDQATIKTTLVLEFSEEEVERYTEVQLEQPATAFSLLESVAEEEEIKVTTKQYDFGIFVESIGGVENTKERAWIYFVNGKSGEVASDQYKLSSGDVVEWRYIEPIY